MQCMFHVLPEVVKSGFERGWLCWWIDKAKPYPKDVLRCFGWLVAGAPQTLLRIFGTQTAAKRFSIPKEPHSFP